MPASNSDARKRHELEQLAHTGLIARWEKAVEQETTIIALSGWAQSGKDTMAGILVEDYGLDRLAFAERLRAVARKSNPIVRVLTDAPHFAWPNGLRWEYIEAEYLYRIDPEGAYEWLKANTTYREFLQNLGTSVREELGELAWVNAALDQVEPGGKYVITDCRFKNEAQAVKDRGGVVWRVHRVGHQPPNDHISEHDLDDWNFDRGFSFQDCGSNLDELRLAMRIQLGSLDFLKAVRA